MAPKSETNVKNVQRLHFVGLILQQVSVFGERIQLIPWCYDEWLKTEAKECSLHSELCCSVLKMVLRPNSALYFPGFVF